MNNNPYHPPSPNGPTRSRIYLKSLVAPVIAMAVTLVLWVASVQFIGRRSSDTTAMLIWAASLLLSLVVAIAIVIRFSRQTASPVAFVTVFAAFAGAFCLLEGDTSNGTNEIQAIIVYGTMASVPLVAGVTSWIASPRVNTSPTQIHG